MRLWCNFGYLYFTTKWLQEIIMQQNTIQYNLTPGIFTTWGLKTKNTRNKQKSLTKIVTNGEN